MPKPAAAKTPPTAAAPPAAAKRPYNRRAPAVPVPEPQPIPEPLAKRPYTRRTPTPSPGLFHAGSLVYVLKSQLLYTLSATGTKRQFEPVRVEPNVALIVQGSIELKRTRYVVARYMGKDVIALPNMLVSTPGEYFFIDSTGTVDKSFTGKTPQVDDFRRKVKNYFPTREKAQARLDTILGVNKPLRASKPPE